MLHDNMSQACKAYFRRRNKACWEHSTAQFGLARLCLDEENLAVLKQLYWWYTINVNFKVKENINKNLRN